MHGGERQESNAVLGCGVVTSLTMMAWDPWLVYMLKPSGIRLAMSCSRCVKVRLFAKFQSGCESAVGGSLLPGRTVFLRPSEWANVNVMGRKRSLGQDSTVPGCAAQWTKLGRDEMTWPAEEHWLAGMSTTAEQSVLQSVPQSVPGQDQQPDRKWRDGRARLAHGHGTKARVKIQVDRHSGNVLFLDDSPRIVRWKAPSWKVRAPSPSMEPVEPGTFPSDGIQPQANKMPGRSTRPMGCRQASWRSWLLAPVPHLDPQWAWHCRGWTAGIAQPQIGPEQGRSVSGRPAKTLQVHEIAQFGQSHARTRQRRMASK